MSNFLRILSDDYDGVINLDQVTQITREKDTSKIHIKVHFVGGATLELFAKFNSDDLKPILDLINA